MAVTHPYKGFWSFICDCETVSPSCCIGIETMTELLRKLQREQPELFPIPPKARKLNERINLLVFVSNDSLEDIKMSAKVIRQNVYYPFITKFFKTNDSSSIIFQYMHTPDDELYEFKPKDLSEVSYWKLIGQKPKPSPFFDNSLSSLVADEQKPNLGTSDEDEKEGKLILKCKKTNRRAALPSQVTDRDHIHLPVDDDEFEKMRTNQGGKWIVHCSDWETLDNTWKKLIPLVDRGILVALKSCSRKVPISNINPSYSTKAIMCYTADAGCKSSVKKAVESICISTGFDYIMYYKSNVASRRGQYRHEGYVSISMYMYTSLGVLFEKDYLHRWKKVDFQ